ncbi:GNAT family N-acetyltransferase [Halomonas sp. CH40]
MLEIKPLSSNHLQALLELEAAAASGMRPAALAAALKAPAIRVLGAWQGADTQGASVLIGYAIVAIGPFDAEIEAIGVLPGWRRHGVAGLLMQALIDAATQAGSERLLLEVRETNDSAIRLYQAFGFTLDGRRKEYYPAVGGTAGRDDALLMSRGLCS